MLAITLLKKTARIVFYRVGNGYSWYWYHHKSETMPTAGKRKLLSASETGSTTASRSLSSSNHNPSSNAEVEEEEEVEVGPEVHQARQKFIKKARNHSDKFVTPLSKKATSVASNRANKILSNIEGSSPGIPQEIYTTSSQRYNSHSFMINNRSTNTNELSSR